MHHVFSAFVCGAESAKITEIGHDLTDLGAQIG